MSKISDYTNYFENIATRFVPIGHTPENSRFATFSREEVLSGRRRDLNLSEWCLVLMNFEIGLRKDGRAFKYEVSGSLEVIKENPRDDISKTDLQDTAEQYVEEIMSQMLKDHDEGTFIGGGKILEDSIELYKLSEAFDQGVGFGLDFKYILPFCRTAAITPTNWLP